MHFVLEKSTSTCIQQLRTYTTLSILNYKSLELF